jgi:large conductance mechanosensitive channel
MSRNLEEKFLVLRKGAHYKDAGGYNTRNQAMEDGAVILTYGYVSHSRVSLIDITTERPRRAFLDHVVSFIGIGVTLYFLANLYGYVSHESIIRHTVKCTYCRKEISAKVRYRLTTDDCQSRLNPYFQAKRCPMCTSWLDGREEKDTSALAPRSD